MSELSATARRWIDETLEDIDFRRVQPGAGGKTAIIRQPALITAESHAL